MHFALLLVLAGCRNDLPIATYCIKYEMLDCTYGVQHSTFPVVCRSLWSKMHLGKFMLAFLFFKKLSHMNTERVNPLDNAFMKNWPQ